jgi:hypothetical protein
MDPDEDAALLRRVEFLGSAAGVDADFSAALEPGRRMLQARVEQLG